MPRKKNTPTELAAAQVTAAEQPPRVKRKYVLRKARPSKRQDILKAAMDVFCYYGYDAATFQAIAREASVSPSLIVKFFHDKETVVHSCVRTFLAEFEAMVREGMQEEGLTYEACMDRIFAFVRDNRPKWVFVQSFTMTPAHADIMARVQLDIVGLGDELTASFGRCAPEDVVPLNHLMTGLLIEYIVGGDEERFMQARAKLLGYMLR